MEQYIRSRSVVSANEELSQAYRPHPDLVDTFGGSVDNSVPLDSLMARLQPSMAHLGIPRAWSGAHSYAEQPYSWRGRQKIEEGRWIEKAARVLTRPQLHTKTMIDGKDSHDSSPPWTTARPDN
ncbi:hypothetical protein E4U19_002936 [Claviceps sp. Clav32 group G5]|nr:hypothetical protein E4U19_002936 [Claviceps sp. Clav32 group G5]KAG6050813.1 hypothetical protein E4U39_003143 [Claviceps sp. Clav50 group G5]